MCQHLAGVSTLKRKRWAARCCIFPQSLERVTTGRTWARTEARQIRTRAGKNPPGLSSTHIKALGLLHASEEGAIACVADANMATCIGVQAHDICPCPVCCSVLMRCTPSLSAGYLQPFRCTSTFVVLAEEHTRDSMIKVTGAWYMEHKSL